VNLWKLKSIRPKKDKYCLTESMYNILRMAFALIYLEIEITGVSYKWYATVAGLPNLFSVID